MKRILVGFDGSEGSENALNKAMMIIDEYGKLIILAVVPLPSDKNFVDKQTYHLMKEKAKNLIKNVVHDIGNHSFEIEGMIEEGDIAAKIIDTANILKCDVIVLGSKGASQLGTYAIGSIANKVVQYAHIPVMIVR
ncbi:MAG: universal stress protein [Thermoplasmatota archaeon]